MSLDNAITQTVMTSRRGLSSMLGLFLNRGCPLCDHDGQPVFCLDCTRQLQDSYRRSMGWHPQDNELIDSASWPISSLGSYEGSLKQALKSLKYSHRPDIATVLGSALAQQWPTLKAPLLRRYSLSSETCLRVVPIPLHHNRYQQRGYNQAELIAAAFCRLSGLKMLPHGLKRIEDTLPQHQLGMTSRQANLSGAFAVGRSLARQPRASKVLLIDDIYTTGATMQSATDVLASSGIDVIGVLAIARAVSD